jgi:P27 family predicted phage terminase small subunit
VKGNPGKRPLPEHEAKIALAEPSPPPFLCDDAKVEWGRVCSILYTAGLMTEADRAALAAYCQAYGNWAQAERAITKLAEKGEINGMLMKTTNGNVIQHALVGIARKARADVVRYAAEFGMTPSARARVQANPTDGEKDTCIQKYFA